MKEGIHPKYYPAAKITCACGAKYAVGSTVPEISVEICGNCHPFYTGKQKLVDTARRVEKFEERKKKGEALVLQKGKGKKAKTKIKKEKQAKKKEAK